MGKEYALLDGESPEVAEAIFEQYLPRFAGDVLPQTEAGGNFNTLASAVSRW